MPQHTPDEQAKRVLLEALREGRIRRDQIPPDVLSQLDAPEGLERVGGLARSFASGVGETLPTAALGLSKGLQKLGVPDFLTPTSTKTDEFEDLLEQRREETAPQHGGEGAARLIGRVLGEGSLGIIGGGAGLAGKGAALAGEVATGVAISGAGAEESILGAAGEVSGSEGLQEAAQNPLLRALTEVGVISGIGLAAKGVSKLRGAREAAARELTDPNPLLLAKGRGVLLRDAAPTPAREAAEKAFTVPGKEQAVFPDPWKFPKIRGDWFRAQYLKWVDIDKPYEWASVPGLLPEDDPAILARVGRRSGGFAARVWDEGLSKVGLKEFPFTPSPRIAVEEYARGDVRGLGYAMIAKREAELRARGLGKRLTDEQLEAGERLFKEDAGINNATAAFKEYWDGWLKYLEEEGVVTEGAAARIKKQGNYWFTPLRITDDSTFGKRGFGVVRSDDPLAKLKFVGEGADITYENPVLASAKLTFQMTDVVAAKRVHTAVAKIGREGLNPDMIRPLKEIPSGAEQIDDFAETFSDLGLNIEGDKLYQIGKDEYVFSFLNRDGTREHFGIDKFLYEAMRAKDTAVNNSILEKIITAPGKSLRTGVTITPGFALSNLTRDQLFRAITDTNLPAGERALFKGALSAIQAVDDLVDSAIHQVNRNLPGGRNIESVRVFDMAGGSMSTLADMDLNRLTKVINDMNKAFPEHTVSLLKARRKISSVIHAARVAGSVSENITRKATFDDVSAKALASGLDEKNANLLGAYASGEASVDFSRRGSLFEENRLVRGLDQGTAFWRATIQSMDRVTRVFGDIERTGVSVNGKSIKRLFATAGVALTAPALANYAYNRQNPDDYFNISKDLRSRYVLFDIGRAGGGLEALLREEIGGEEDEGKSILKSGNSLYMKIPVPHELGWAFATIPVRLLEEVDPANPFVANDPLVKRLGGAFGPLSTAIADLAGPFNPLSSSFGGTGIGTTVQLARNRDIFRDLDIEDTFEREQLRGGPTALVSEIGADKASLGAQGISQALNPVFGKLGIPTSPAQVEFGVQNITGGAGSAALDLTDLAATKEAQKPAESPLVRRFFVDPRGKGTAGDEFYEEYFRLRSKVQGSKTLEDRDKTRDALRSAPTQEEALRFNAMNVLYERLRDLSEAQRIISNNEALTPESRREINDEIRAESMFILKGGTYRAEDLPRLLEKESDPERSILLDNLINAIEQDKAAKAKIRRDI